AVEDGSGRAAQMALPLADAAVAAAIAAAPSAPPAKPGKAPIPVAEILAAIAESAKGDGWSTVNDIRLKLAQHLPQLNLRNYGYRKFSDLVSAINGIEKHVVKSGSGTSLAVRLRTAVPPA